ncbi:predicted protein [Thalassiosira pseudonana CCMP1335]|uniref:AB hydrolase-1 domain-containing protein n=1 Tax=Thalassiosira pseudonana TaxID=35128 RepID=B8BZB9_THAPS|nr:predicted protein [Thalassiosira pseudonana CCMP1335]EED92855.1 predicted protein [Thalassiosira pseudonana CCMP1335]
MSNSNTDTSESGECNATDTSEIPPLSEMYDKEYPGTAVRRLRAVHERVAILATDGTLDGPWEEVRRRLLWAGGLRDLPNAAPGQGYTGHSFNDWNHVDCTTMLGDVSDSLNDGSIKGIAKGNLLGPGIRIASLPELGEGGSWSTCAMGCNQDPPNDVAHVQFRSRVAFKLVWVPNENYDTFVLVDDEGKLMAKGTPSDGSAALPHRREREMNFQIMKGSKYATVAESVAMNSTRFCPLVLRRLQSASESATEHRETMVNVVCEDCQAPIRRLFGLLKGSTTPCSRCNKALCGKCSGNHALIPFDENEKDEPPKKESILSYCKQCFQEVSLLDYSKTYDIVEPSNEDGANNDITLLWVHGGGSSRLMFRPHARLLAKQGYRSILMDLPGHGTLVDNTALTLDECVKTVQSVLQNEGCDATKTIYIGGSLGAYIGFHILKELNGKFAGAILMDCGQNVGPDCSLKARIGIVVLRKMSGSMSNKALMGAMMGAVNKSKADFHLVESCYSGGMFFQQGPNQCDCMHQVAPASIIPSLDLPIFGFHFAKTGGLR